MTRGLVALAVVALAASPASAERFRFPSSCHDGCMVVSAYFDHDPSGGMDIDGCPASSCHDWACGTHSYNNHTGSDFALVGGFAAQDEGREVVAAAEGTVVYVVDGGFDRCTSGACSGLNEVRVRHDDGTVTRYLHLRRWSIRVGVGDRVGCGQGIALAGSSGYSTGPHLHFDFWNPGGGFGSREDPYGGACSGGSYWVEQGGYGRWSLPGTRCARPDDDGDGSPQGEDCDDRDPRRRPGLAEVCDGVDNDCDGGIDEGVTRACGSDVGACRRGTETCASGAWGACEGGVRPASERCDAVDNDCDGETDEGQVCEREEAALSEGLEGSSSDVDGDGTADACARTAEGFTCLAGGPQGFSRALRGPAMTDEGGLDAVAFSSGLRLGDLDGDGRADVCARRARSIVCWREVATGGTLHGEVALPDGVTNVLLADVDGDGRDDVCARGPEGVRCHLSLARGFGRAVPLDALSDAAGFGDVSRWATLRAGDVDGDGRADLCARGGEGVRCWRASGDAFVGALLGPSWGDAQGWSALARWATIRLADVDGDGRADLCARGAEGYRCHLAVAQGFGPARLGPALPDEDGWGRPEGYSTLRLGDLDGDGDLDLCGRAREGARCWRWSGVGFDRAVPGPSWTDASGWDRPTRYRSLRLADVTGDGRADLCARDAEGLRCHASDGVGFPRVWLASRWTDAEGFDDLARVASVRLAGTRRPRVERSTEPGCACTAGRARVGGGWLGALVALAGARRRRWSEACSHRDLKGRRGASL